MRGGGLLFENGGLGKPRGQLREGAKFRQTCGGANTEEVGGGNDIGVAGIIYAASVCLLSCPDLDIPEMTIYVPRKLRVVL